MDVNQAGKGQQANEKKPNQEAANSSTTNPITANLPQELDGFYYCKFCSRKYDTANKLYFHMEVHSPKPTCRICNLSYSTGSVYNYHMDNKHGICLTIPRSQRPCKHCGRHFRRKLRIHEIACGQRQKFTCPLCNRVYECANYFKRHVDSKDCQNPHKRPIQKYPCRQCGKEVWNRPRHEQNYCKLRNQS